MVTLSVTGSRIAATLAVAAGILDIEGWDALRNPIAAAIDRAADFTPGKSSTNAEEVTVLAVEMLAGHLALGAPDGSGYEPLTVWERQPGRTEADVLAALRGAAGKQVAS
jgi:hypothetical protein